MGDADAWRPAVQDRHHIAQAVPPEPGAGVPGEGGRGEAVAGHRGRVRRVRADADGREGARGCHGRVRGGEARHARREGLRQGPEPAGAPRHPRRAEEDLTPGAPERGGPAEHGGGDQAARGEARRGHHQARRDDWQRERQVLHHTLRRGCRTEAHREGEAAEGDRAAAEARLVRRAGAAEQRAARRGLRRVHGRLRLRAEPPHVRDEAGPAEGCDGDARAVAGAAGALEDDQVRGA
mmetsp:Transcript_22723/g.77304  ORF Transcript_22723/g.77304 Transcript_22723/m.77304 type:complete len:237 (-) Transcript_22723:1025-1735(-)